MPDGCAVVALPSSAFTVTNSVTLWAWQLVVAFPAGWLADRTRRDAVLCLAAGIGAIAGLSLLTAVIFELQVAYIFAAAALLGTYRGFNNPALESIYADSVPTGYRYIFRTCQCPHLQPQQQAVKGNVAVRIRYDCCCALFSCAKADCGHESWFAVACIPPSIL